MYPAFFSQTVASCPRPPAPVRLTCFERPSFYPFVQLSFNISM